MLERIHALSSIVVPLKNAASTEALREHNARTLAHRCGQLCSRQQPFATKFWEEGNRNPVKNQGWRDGR
jgi:hypothetical protein